MDLEEDKSTNSSSDWPFAFAVSIFMICIVAMCWICVGALNATK